jgi:hypothetical protein
MEFTNGIHFCPMFHRCKMDKMLLGAASREAFILLSRPSFGSFTSLPDTINWSGSTKVARRE